MSSDPLSLTFAALADPTRRALLARFLKSQHAVRRDPWAERAAGRELQEFMPLAVMVPVRAVAAE